MTDPVTDPVTDPRTAGGARWTLITVTFNSARVLARYWAAGVPTGADWIVVANASPDDTVAVARDLGAQVVALPENVGFARANNVALRRTVTPLTCFVNPDVTVLTGSLEALAHALEEADGLVAPQLLNPDRSQQANGRGLPFLHHKVLHRLRPTDPRVAEEYVRHAAAGERIPVAWVMGAAVAGRTATFRELAGWDESFFIYYEDKDLCLRSWQAGTSVHLVGDAHFVHGWERATTRLRWTPWKHEMASMVRFYRRHPATLWSRRWARRRYPELAAALAASRR